jgi:hypothetical protein
MEKRTGAFFSNISIDPPKAGFSFLPLFRYTVFEERRFTNETD